MECVECEATCGWISIEEHTVSVNSSGEVRLGEGTRWGKQIKMKCNNPNCDAIVNMYLDSDLEVDRWGEVEKTGAEEIKEKYLDSGDRTVKRLCEGCGREMIVKLTPRITRKGNFILTGQHKCKQCDRMAGFITKKVLEIDPKESKE